MALRVAQYGKELSVKGKTNMNERIHKDYPFLKSELAYTIKYEMAQKPNDVLCRRVPIGILNKELAKQLIPEVVELMAKERKWSNAQKK